MTESDDLTPPPRPADDAPQTIKYEPRGAAKDLFYCRAPEVLLEGPAGTGKSLAALQKMHLVALKYPGVRLAFLRKTRVSIRQSLLVTWENFVRPYLNGVRFNKDASEYRYPNGTIIALGGLDKTSKLMSSEWDMIFLQEATEAIEDDIQDLTTRLRNGKMPYQQLIMDCNPGPEKHWLHQRSMEGGPTVAFRSVHKDNPSLWNFFTEEWTERGAAYIARLQSLRGVRRKRLYEGLWASAEGMVYDEWEPRIHIIRHHRISPHMGYVFYWSVDFGFTNPFVAQLWAVDNQGVLILVREIYMSHLLVEDHARVMRAIQGYLAPSIRAVICDHDAEGRATLEKYLGVQTTPAYKPIREGIQAVQARMRVNPEIGRPMIQFMDMTLNKLDPEQSDPEIGKSNPTKTIEEIEGYVWDTANNRKKGEEPVDKDNHGMDCMRYMVAYIDDVGSEHMPPDLLVMGATQGWNPTHG